MKTTSGFTVVESLSAIVFLGIVGTICFDTYQSVRMTHRDQDRKIAINAMHYTLEEVVKPKLGGYPRTLTIENMAAMDRKLLADPAGITLGQPTSDYRYEATGCRGGDVCTGYTLRADLEQEADFVKTPAAS